MRSSCIVSIVLLGVKMSGLEMNLCNYGYTKPAEQLQPGLCKGT